MSVNVLARFWGLGMEWLWSRRAQAAAIVGCTVVLAACQATPPPTLLAGHDASPRGLTPPVLSSRCRAVRERPGGLAGRTLTVNAIGDIALAPKEVVLTFDDGPLPRKTPRILDILDEKGVKATFLMVGQMASAYPSLVRQVAARGHTIGSHTYGHPNLRKRSHSAALAEIARGERAIAAALSGSGYAAAPYFRFPYLADTAALRGALAKRGTVVIDVDIDSKDYYKTTPDRVLARTLSRLDARGRGIILFHDLHARTVAMLPRFLARLEERGYKVVHMAPGGVRGTGCRRSVT